MDIRELLEKVRGGKLEIDAAEKYLRSHSGVRAYEEMGYAKLDTDSYMKRKGRCSVRVPMPINMKSSAPYCRIFLMILFPVS